MSLLKNIRDLNTATAYWQRRKANKELRAIKELLQQQVRAAQPQPPPIPAQFLKQQ